MKSFQSLGFSIMYDLGGYLLLIIKIFVKVFCSEHETKCLIYLKWLIFLKILNLYFNLISLICVFKLGIIKKFLLLLPLPLLLLLLLLLLLSSPSSSSSSSSSLSEVLSRIGQSKQAHRPGGTLTQAVKQAYVVCCLTGCVFKRVQWGNVNNMKKQEASLVPSAWPAQIFE